MLQFINYHFSDYNVKPVIYFDRDYLINFISSLEPNTTYVLQPEIIFPKLAYAIVLSPPFLIDISTNVNVLFEMLEKLIEDREINLDFTNKERT
jgi:hypothetical protein